MMFHSRLFQRRRAVMRLLRDGGGCRTRRWRVRGVASFMAGQGAALRRFPNPDIRAPSPGVEALRSDIEAPSLSAGALSAAVEALSSGARVLGLDIEAQGLSAGAWSAAVGALSSGARVPGLAIEAPSPGVGACNASDGVADGAYSQCEREVFLFGLRCFEMH
jgi:hypothetical protein